MTEPTETSPAEVGLEEPPAPAPRDPGGLTLVEVLAALGFALLLVSSALAWAAQPFIPEGGGVYPGSIPMPNLLSAESTGRLPNLGLVLVAFAVPGLALAMLRWRLTWVAALQTLLAALLAASVVLFGLRWNSFFEQVEDASFVGSLRAGIYIALVGSLLALVASIVSLVKAPRPASEPRGLGVLPEDLA
jgi:hypothetical protein